MSPPSAKYLLDLYSFRVRCAEEGVTHPDLRVVSGAKRLVCGLSILPPDTEIRLEIQDGRNRFLVAATGELVAEIESPAT